MEKVEIVDAQARFSEIVERVSQDSRPITISRDGVPVVEIVPASAASDSGLSRKEAIADLAKLRSELESMSDQEIVDLVHEGRP